jgi:hypothetical protein
MRLKSRYLPVCEISQPNRIYIFSGCPPGRFTITVCGFAAGVDSKVQKFVHLQMFKKVKLFTLADCHACAKPMLAVGIFISVLFTERFIMICISMLIYHKYISALNSRLDTLLLPVSLQNN